MISSETHNIIYGVIGIICYIGQFLFFIGAIKKKKKFSLIGFGFILFTNIMGVGLDICNYLKTGYYYVFPILPSLLGRIIQLVFWSVILLISIKSISSELKESNIQSVFTKPMQDNNDKNLDEIYNYKDLLDIGAITQEEFDAKKKELLGL